MNFTLSGIIAELDRFKTQKGQMPDLVFISPEREKQIRAWAKGETNEGQVYVHGVRFTSDESEAHAPGVVVAAWPEDFAMNIYRPLRYDTDNSRTIDSPPEVEAFLDEYEALCRKHGLSLGHEDEHGSFVVEKPIDGNVEWARAASLKLGKDPGAPKVKLPPAPWE